MTQRLSIGLTLLLSLVWLTSSLINVRAAARNTLTDYVVELSLPAETLAGQTVPLDKAQLNQEAVTQTSTYNLYFPVIFRNACATSFSYNETLRYNLTIINIETAWQSCFQGQDITVAVIDTGIDLDHPDLQANLVTGKSFVPGTSSADDDAGHGTHVAGIIGAVNNNGGVIGVAPQANLMPVKVLNSQGSGSISQVADGIIWAADHGADVINLSLGSVSDSSTLKAAIDYAYNQGVLVVAAGGNCGDSSYFSNGCYYQDQPVYPGAYSNVMAVASTDSNDHQSSFSNQGSYIDIAAPGSSIYSTYPSGSYTTLSGTSMATPHVAGLAALIWSQDSTLTNGKVATQIKNTAEDLGSNGWDQQFGYGRIDAAAAMGVQQSSSTMIGTTLSSADVSPADTTTQAPYIPGEILLKLQAGVSVNKVLDQTQLETAEVQVADTIEPLGVQKLSVTTGQEQALLAQLRHSSGVEYAELNYVVRIH